MQTLRNILHLGVKELRILMRDPFMLIFIVWAFTLAIYIAATAMPETLNKAPIAVVDEDRSQLSMRLIDALYPPYFLPPIFITSLEMDARMDAGLDTFALQIPADFQKDVLSGHMPALQLNIDATRMSQAFIGSGYIQAILNKELNLFLNQYAVSNTLPVELELRAEFNPELNQSWFGAVIELVERITLLSIILTGAALIREREQGTVEHLLVMPVTPFEIMCGKIWAMGLVVLLASAFALSVIVQGILAVPIEGSIILFLLGVTLHLFATTSMGIFLGTIAKTMPQFALLMMMTLLPLQILSGGMTPQESMPNIIRYIMQVAPTTHFVNLSQAILYRGAGIEVIWPQLIILLIIGLCLFMMSLGRFRKHLGTVD